MFEHGYHGYGWRIVFLSNTELTELTEWAGALFFLSNTELTEWANAVGSYIRVRSIKIPCIPCIPCSKK